MRLTYDEYNRFAQYLESERCRIRDKILAGKVADMADALYGLTILGTAIGQCQLAAVAARENPDLDVEVWCIEAWDVHRIDRERFWAKAQFYFGQGNPAPLDEGWRNIATEPNTPIERERVITKTGGPDARKPARSIILEEMLAAIRENTDTLSWIAEQIAKNTP